MEVQELIKVLERLDPFAEVYLQSYHPCGSARLERIEVSEKTIVTDEPIHDETAQWMEIGENTKRVRSVLLSSDV